MPRVNFANVRTETTIPAGYYNFLLASCEEMWTKNAALMYVVEMRVHEPESQRGRAYREYLTLGKRPFDPGNRDDSAWQQYADLDDPDCEDPVNHEMNPDMQQLKRIMENAGIDCNKEYDLEDLMELINAGGLYIGGRLIVEEEQREGRFKGQMRNRLTYIYEQDRETSRIDDVPAATARRNGRPAETPMMQQVREGRAQRNRTAASQD